MGTIVEEDEFAASNATIPIISVTRTKERLNPGMST